MPPYTTRGIGKTLAAPGVDKIMTSLQQAASKTEGVFKKKKELTDIEHLSSRAKSGLKGSFIDDLMSIALAAGGFALGGTAGAKLGLSIAGAGIGKGVSRAIRTKDVGKSLKKFGKERAGTEIGKQASDIYSDFRSAKHKAIKDEAIGAGFKQWLMPLEFGNGLIPTGVDYSKLEEFLGEKLGLDKLGIKDGIKIPEGKFTTGPYGSLTRELISKLL